jgi:CheY-like chemotaxis protein
MIVDDNNAVRAAIGRQLRRIGLETVEALDGNDALHVLKTVSVDLIISDGDMPGLNGRELFERLPDDLRRNFLAYTGNCELFNGAACPVIQKPDTAGLLRAVREVLGRNEA